MTALIENASNSEARKCSENRRKNSKKGCRTCKIRKVKCDLGRPACNRCMSTGRVCDGYGIWGGGGTVAQLTIATQSYPSAPLRTFTDFTGPYEHDFFDWFRCQTVTKLPGIYPSQFWTLAMQASHSEPVILHAALALSSVHKKPEFSIRWTTSDKQRFTLEHYGKALGLLQRHFVHSNRASVRIALMACVLFTCLELLRGRYRTANKHLIHGIRLLNHFEEFAPECCDISPRLCKIGLSGHTDRWIVDAFMRLAIPAVFFNSENLGLRLAPKIEANVQTVPVIFESFQQARGLIDRLVAEIITIFHQCSQRDPMQGPSQDSIDAQSHVQGDLNIWSTTYTASRINLQSQMGEIGTLPYLSLGTYHIVVTIMVDTCLEPYNQQNYDRHLGRFRSIIERSIQTYRLVKFSDWSKTPFEHRADVPSFVADRGFITPLYFTALKCRDHSTRLQAARLLAVAHTREGTLDSTLAAAVAQEVIEIEEADFYTSDISSDCCTNDDFMFDAGLQKEYTELPILPQALRVQEVVIVLPDSPEEKTLLRCTRKHPNGELEILTREYDPVIQSWTNRLSQTASKAKYQ